MLVFGLVYQSCWVYFLLIRGDIYRLRAENYRGQKTVGGCNEASEVSYVTAIVNVLRSFLLCIGATVHRSPMQKGA